MPAHTAPLASAYPVAPASNPPATVGLPNGVKGVPYCVPRQAHRPFSLLLACNTVLSHQLSSWCNNYYPRCLALRRQRSKHPSPHSHGNPLGYLGRGPRVVEPADRGDCRCNIPHAANCQGPLPGRWEAGKPQGPTPAGLRVATHPEPPGPSNQGIEIRGPARLTARGPPRVPVLQDP